MKNILSGVAIVLLTLLFSCLACQNDRAEVDSQAGDYDIPDYDGGGLAADHKNIAIYYDKSSNGSADDYTHGMLKAVMLRNLLGHFNVDVGIFSADEYKAGDIDNYDAVMYIGTVDGTSFRHAFLGDIYDTEKPVYWIGLNFDAFAFSRTYDAVSRWGISYNGNTTMEGAAAVEYKGRSLAREAGDPYFVSAQPANSSDCEIKASIKNSSQSLPLLLECHNLFFMTDDPFSNPMGAYLVLADSLHDFLETKNTSERKAVLRIQGVSPGVNTSSELKELAGRLAELGVPFMLSVVPRYVDVEGVTLPKGSEKSLAAAEELAATLKDLHKKRGASIIANGFTHQNKKSSYLDYEFWNIESNRAVPEDSWEWAAGRLNSSLSEFRSAGLEVNLWQSPSYMASYTDYFVFAAKIAAVNERPLVFDTVNKPADGEYIYTGDWYFKNQSLPYMVYKSHYGFGIIPENLGGVALEQSGERGLPLDADTIELFATEHLAVRDALVGLYFNIWESGDELIEAVKRVQNLGYKFVNAEDLLADAPPEFEDNAADGDADGDSDESSEVLTCIYGPDECPRPTGCHNGFCGRCTSAFECREYETCRSDGSCGDCSDDNACRAGSVCRYGYCMPSRIETYNIIIDPANFETMVTDVENQTYYPCELEYEGKDYSTGQTECRLQGYSSRKKYPKKSFRIKFPEGADHPGYSRKIVLKADYNDPTFMRSMLSFETSRRLTGVPTPRIRYRRVEINGEYYGLFMEIERISGSFMEERGRDGDQSIYDADFTPPYGGLVPLESADQYPRYYQKRNQVEGEPMSDLIDLIENVLWKDYRQTGPHGVTSLTRTEDAVHLERYVDYLATMALIQNIDTVENNYTFSWQQLDGRYAWEFYPWDMDISFGCQWNDEARNAICRGLTSEMWWLSGIALDGVEIGTGKDVWCNMLTHLALNHPWTRRLYEDRLCEFVHSGWWNSDLPRFVKALHSTVNDYVKDDPNDLCTSSAEWQQDIDYLLKFVKDRKVYLENELRCYDEDYR